MDRWHRLESAIVEIEQFARAEERERVAKHITSLEAKLARTNRELEETRNQLQAQREASSRMEQHASHLRIANERLHSANQAFQLLQVRDDVLETCRLGDAEGLAILLDVKTSTNDRAGEMMAQELKDEALRIAASEGFVNVCKVLLNHGADPTARERENGQNALHRAVSALGSSDAILHLLVQCAQLEFNVRGRINDVDFNGQTPLSLAARLLRVDRVLCLLSLGADTTMVSREDWKRLNDFQVKQEEEVAAEDGKRQGVGASKARTPASLQNAAGLNSLTLQDPTAFSSSSSSLADTLFQQGQFQEALEQYGLEKQDHHALIQASRCCAMLNRHCDAIDFANRALQSLPTCREALQLRAESRLELFDYEAALADYQELGDDDSISLARDGLRQRNEDFYGLLGIASTATNLEVRKAFLKQCLRWHPDKNRQTRDDEMRSGFMFKAVNDAHLVLMDLKRRREYDNQLLLRAREAEAAEEEYSEDQDGGGGSISSFEEGVEEDPQSYYYEYYSSCEETTMAKEEEAENREQDRFFAFLQKKSTQ